MKSNIDWNQLKGRGFRTITGTRFMVVKVTAKNLLIQPEGSRRNYDLSIHNELERGIEAYSAGRFFPAPSDLLTIGVRAVRTSYVWGVLRQVLIQDDLPIKVDATQAKNFIGDWQITELSDLDQSYIDESDELPYISIRTSAHEQVYGDYHFGLSDGHLGGQVREFNGLAVLLFGYDGSDEMDPANGAGWAQLQSQDRLVGEFLGVYGRFIATRENGSQNRRNPHHPKPKRTKP